MNTPHKHRHKSKGNDTAIIQGTCLVMLTIPAIVAMFTDGVFPVRLGGNWVVRYFFFCIVEVVLVRIWDLISKAISKAANHVEEESLSQLEDTDTSYDYTMTDRDISSEGEPKLISSTNIQLSQEAKRSNPLEELNSLIGLDEVKSEVTRLTNFINIQHKRMNEGLKTSPISYHCIFTGNPGTGKTTVARIIAKIYKELGVISKGHLIETDRSGLVGEYVGQTAVKTNKIIDSAIDGVLFIDEAYTLVTGSNSDFGIEAISTLLKRMEDDRHRLVVILAGYGDEMKAFINSNPGLQSRFNRYIHFPDYTRDELIELLQLYIRQNDYKLTQGSETAIHEVMSYAVEHKDKNFGNARFVRNLFENILERQATRLASEEELPKTRLQEICPEDIPTPTIK